MPALYYGINYPHLCNLDWWCQRLLGNELNIKKSMMLMLHSCCKGYIRKQPVVESLEMLKNRYKIRVKYKEITAKCISFQNICLLIQRPQPIQPISLQIINHCKQFLDSKISQKNKKLRLIFFLWLKFITFL
jgi:hypothetical protein